MVMVSFLLRLYKTVVAGGSCRVGKVEILVTYTEGGKESISNIATIQGVFSIIF